MRHTIRTMLAMMAGALALCACSREELAVPASPKMMTFTVLQESSEQSKTSLEPTSGSRVIWSAGDKLCYFGGGNDEFLTLSEGEGTNEGTFAGMVTATGDDYVLYPYTPSASCAKGTIKTYIPSVQSVPAGGFDPSAVVMVGKVKADGGFIQFRNAVGLLGITIPEGETSISKMVICGNDNERLSGMVTISGISTTGAPAVAATARRWETDGSGAGADGVKYIEVSPAEEGNFKPGCTYHVAVAPDAALSKGIYLLLYNGSTATPSALKLAVKKSGSDMGMGRNRIRVTALPAVAEAEWKGMVELASLNGEGPLYMAPFNIGATRSLDSEGDGSYGSYFSFGEVDTKESYTTTLYQSAANLSAQNGTDAAAANWGPDWRMPSSGEFNTNLEQEKLNSALPLAGCLVGSSLEDAGRVGHYWVSTGGDGSMVAFFRGFNRSFEFEHGAKQTGRSVRPVMAERKSGQGNKLWSSRDCVSVSFEGNEVNAYIYGTVDFETEIVDNEDGWFRITVSDESSDKAPFVKKVSVSTDFTVDRIYRSCTLRYYNTESGLSGSVRIDQDFLDGIAIVNGDAVIPKEGGDFAIVVAASGCDIDNISLPSWIKQVKTKSPAFDTLYVKADPTPYRFERMSTIVITPTNGPAARFDLRQEGDETKDGVPDDEIWYTMRSGHILDFSQNWTTPFDRTVLSVTYEDGMGKVKFDGAVKNVFTYALARECHHVIEDDGSLHAITNVYLPDCVESLGENAFSGCLMETFYLPSGLKSISHDVFYGLNIKRFTGRSATADGSGVVIGDSFYALAPAYEGTSYTVPAGVTNIARGAFSGRSQLKDVILPEGLKVIADDAFGDCQLEYVTLPSSLEHIGYNVFTKNPVREFRGDSRFISSDRLFLQDDYPYGDGKYILAFANGCGKESYVIPEGILAVDSYSFSNNSDLKYLTFPKSFMKAYSDAFSESKALCGLFGEHVSTDNKSLIVDNELQFTVPNGVEHIYIDSPVDRIGDNSMQFNNDLKTIVINDNVSSIGNYAFSYSRNVESITLPAALVSLGHDPFSVCSSLKDVWVRSVDPPTVGEIYKMDYRSDLKFHVPAESLERYRNNVYWQALRDYIVGYEYTDLPGSTSSYYSSTDYSADGRVKTLQKATRGKGIDIVLMGEAYTDAMIADGTYDERMARMHEALFVEEPYKSYRGCFNVYQVDVVSKNGLIADDALTALNCKFTSGTKIEGGHNAVQTYAGKAVSDLSNALLIVLVNESNRLGGTCYMFDGKAGRYGAGLSICYFSDIKDQRGFEGIVNHEAMGHGFAKLGDEYAYESNGTYVPGADSRLAYNETMGWFKNIDDEGDASAIKWARLLADERYAGTGLGIFEGGYTYWKGIYRPTDYSLMRYNDGGFNAPSREAAWCRIQYLSNGDEWTYDYEDFVSYDAINRTPVSQTAAKARTAGMYVNKAQQHCPPVMMGKLR